MKKIVIIDGQGGKIGRLIIEQLKLSQVECELYAMGTNSIATSTMIKAGANFGATGENPIVVNCRDADIIVGPIGIVIADALLGEITPLIATSIGQSLAQKILLPINRCRNYVVGTQELPTADLISLAVKRILELL